MTHTDINKPPTPDIAVDGNSAVGVNCKKRVPHSQAAAGTGIAVCIADTICGSTPFICARLKATPGISAKTAYNLERVARKCLAVLSSRSGDSWSQVDISAFGVFCNGDFADPFSGQPSSKTRESAKVRRWAADRVVRAACDFGALAPDSALVLHVDPPAVVDQISELPENHPERIAHVVANWQSRIRLGDDEDEAAERSALLRSWVTTAGPSTVSSATTWLGCVADHMTWAADELGTTEPALVWHPSNVESSAMNKKRDWSPAWRAQVRGLLRRIGRAVCPEVCPAQPAVIGVQPVSQPYDAVEEFLFIEVAQLEDRMNRRERLWLTAATLGAGLSGADAFRSGPGDLVELDGGRLGIRVQRGREQIVPIRDKFTELVDEARELCGNGQERFFESARPQRTYEIAYRIAVKGLGRLLIPRARASFLCAHILSGTSLIDLDEFAGHLGATYMRQLLDHCQSQRIGSVDPLEVANRGLGP